MLKKIGSNIEPWDTAKSISSQELYEWFILVLCFFVNNYEWDLELLN